MYRSILYSIFDICKVKRKRQRACKLLFSIKNQMVATKNVLGEEEIPEDMSDDNSVVMVYSDPSSTDSSMSEEESDSYETMTDSDDEEEAAAAQNIKDEDEDELIKKIRKENQKKKDHPPSIQLDDFITDLSFHPHENLIAAANMVGEVVFYKYAKEKNQRITTLDLHTKACRDIEFTIDGKLLLSCSKDKSIMLTEFQNGITLRTYKHAHDVPIYCLSALCENLFATGDDDGCVKLWDSRDQSSKPIFKMSKNEDFISSILSDGNENYLVCSSGDGSITTIDIRQRKFHVQSEEYEDEFLCMALLRNDTKLLVGTTKGKLLTFNWNEFGLHSDSFSGPDVSINDMIAITENIVICACDDGNVRALNFFPNRHLGIVGQHKMSVENVDICNDGTFIATSSHNCEIKFWNIQYFEDFERVSHKHKKNHGWKEMKHNLPSSKNQNVADFFSDL